MKNFLFKNCRISRWLIHLPAIFMIVVGIFIPLAVEQSEEISDVFAVFMLVCLGLGLLWEIMLATVPALRQASKGIDSLVSLSYGRKYFSLPEPTNRRELTDLISGRAENKLDFVISAASSGFVGRWQGTKRRINSKNVLFFETVSCNFYLYSVDCFDGAYFDFLKSDILKRLKNDRAEQREISKSRRIINAICILADQVDEDVAVAASTISELDDGNMFVAGMRVVVGDVPNNRFYLNAARDIDVPQSKAYVALSLISDVCFDTKLSSLPSLGKLPSDEYTGLMNELISGSLSERDAKEKQSSLLYAFADSEDELFVDLSEGEIRRHGDRLGTVMGGKEIVAWLLLPEDAEEIMSEDDEGDDLDAEDLEASLEVLLKEADEKANLPTVPANYRGDIVLDVCEYASIGNKTKRLKRDERDAALTAFNGYLKNEGFEKIYLMDEKSETLVLM